MGDRQDIDALLIGALYGELDAGERARLDAHLASHPTDRAAMDSLSETRTRVRDSLALLPEVEPAPAISTLILQEAARRAPRRAAAPGEKAGVLGWLSSIFQPIVRHPALAGAFALVLVGGAAGLLYQQGKVSPSDTTVVAEGGGESAGATGAAAPQSPAPSPPAAAATATPDVANLRSAPSGSAAGSGSADSYQVQLAEQQQRAQVAQAAKDGDLDRSVVAGDDTPAHRQIAAAPPKGAAKPHSDTARKSPGYFDVAPQDRQPKQLDGLAIADGPGGAPSPSGGAGGGGASANAGAAPGRPATTENAISSADAAATAPKAAPAASGAYDQGEDAKTTEWAQLQHQRLAQLVKAGNCVEAGKLGGEIAARAPEYYAAHVENDRAVRGCKQYIDHDKRKKADEAAKSRSRSAQPDLEAEPAPAMH